MNMRKLIVVVDDDPHTLKLMKKLLGRAGHIVLCKPNAESVLNVVDALNIDLFLLDIMMPNMDGFALYEALRNIPRFKDTPIIMLSAKTDPCTRRHVNEIGVNAFVPKIEMSLSLLPTVRKILSEDDSLPA